MSKERELLLWLQGYLYDKSDLGNREMIMLKDKIGAFIDKDDNEEPNPKITYWGGSPACNNPDTVRPRDTQPWELDPNEVTCSDNTDPFVQSHDGTNFFESTTSDVYNAQWTIHPDGRLVWEELDSEGNPVKQEPAEDTEREVFVANALVETLEEEVEELQEKIANLERHNDWLMKANAGNVADVIQDNIAMIGNITDLDQTVTKQNDKIIELGAENDNLANVICKQNETIFKRDLAIKELKFKLKMYTREIEQLEEIIGDDTREIQRLQSILYERDIDF